jgi:hypothetical protein
MKTNQPVAEQSAAPAMRANFRIFLTALAALEKLAPARGWPRLTAPALIKAAGVEISAGAEQGLRQLIAAMQADSELTMFGRLSVHWDFCRLLRNAAQIERRIRDNPAIATAKVTAPIFILGLPRSGTTFLHELLAQDCDNLVPRVWQTIYPEPRPKDFAEAGDRRVKIVNRQLKFFAGVAPEFAQLHPIDADSPQECSEITSQVFQSLRFDTTFRVPEYLNWIDARGHVGAFEFHRRFLQVLQHGTAAARWVLKCPDHSFCLDTILAIYPDARFIVVHRDPMKVFASVAHLTEVLRRPFLKNIDPVEIGNQVTARWIAGAQRLVDFDRREDIDPMRKIHVHYDELANAPMPVVARIYAHFGIDLPAAAGTAMALMLNCRKSGGYGGDARYVPDRFGINPQRLQPQFSAYMDYFSVRA